MGKLVEPKVFHVGETSIDYQAVEDYLKYVGCEDFMETIHAARKEGVSSAGILCSMFAKLCYKSLTADKNANISRVRDIPDNLKGTFKAAHGSIFEHVSFNFIITDCSRVFTHELVRHRIGTAFSQTSGRYTRPIDENGKGVLDLVFDPILDDVQGEVEALVVILEAGYADIVEKSGVNDMKDFARKKKITSALRRILPNGQSNEIAFSVNLRSLRHTILMRTARYSEWEIRLVFEQIYNLVKEKYPHLFQDAKEEIIDGIVEVTGMRMQPYEARADD